MLPANFQIHLDYSPEQRFMAEFAVSQRWRLIDVTTEEMSDVGIEDFGKLQKGHNNLNISLEKSANNKEYLSARYLKFFQRDYFAL